MKRLFIYTLLCLLSITIRGQEIINFVDSEVKQLCVSNWDTDGDQELSKDEAAAVSSLGIVFHGNETITSFDELQFFTGINCIPPMASMVTRIWYL